MSFKNLKINNIDIFNMLCKSLNWCIKSNMNQINLIQVN